MNGDTGPEPNTIFPPPPGGRLLRSLQWFIIPLLILTIVCRVAGPWVRSRESGYIALLENPPAERVNAVFIGQSRVEAAINTEMFNKTVITQGERTCTSVNLGGHGRTPAVNWFGLKLLLQKMPDKFAGTTVFVEAPGGLPETGTWDQSWVNAGEDKAIVPLLATEDVARMASASHSSALDRAGLRWLQAENRISLLYYRRIAGRRLMGSLTELAQQAAAALHLGGDASGSSLDIQAGGTILTDVSAAITGLNTANAYVREHQSTAALIDWNQTILNEIRLLMQKAGGHLVIYTLPVHSMFNPVYQSAQAATSRESLRMYCEQNDIPLLAPDFKATDSDFPDYWHLTREQGEEFTHRLAEAWLKTNPAR